MIGQSAAKLLSALMQAYGEGSETIMASIWRRFRDYNGVGLRKLATFNEDLRDSPSSL